MGPRKPGARSRLRPASQGGCGHVGPRLPPSSPGRLAPALLVARTGPCQRPQPQARAVPGVISAADAGSRAAGQASAPRHLERSWLGGCQELPPRLLNAMIPPCSSRWDQEALGSSVWLPQPGLWAQREAGAEGCRPPRPRLPPLQNGGVVVAALTWGSEQNHQV